MPATTSSGTPVATGVPLEVVAGTAPGWEEPWSRARRVWVASDVRGWRLSLLDDDGFELDLDDVQAARLLPPEL